MLFSVALAAPVAHAAPSDSGHDGGNSSEHRDDANAHAQRDERRASTSAPAANQPAQAADQEAGPLDQPQPASNADFSGNGANDHGAYDSTRDGSASGNGNGGGAAIGKPCAGCVGKADNKNPHGQFPDGSDSNNGYECDGNSGIAKTNPAHTGCLAPTSPSAPTVRAASAEVLGVVFAAPAVTPAVLSVGTVAPASASPATLATTGSSGIVPIAVFGGVLILVGAMLRRGTARRVA